MRLFLLILFIAMPLMEIAVLIQLGQIIGFWMTILLVIATAVIGTTVLHAQGFSVLRRANETLRRGAPPIEPVAEGVLLIVAGAFLLTPGLITDSLGAILLIPPFRQWIARWGLERLLGFATFDNSIHENYTYRDASADPTDQRYQNGTVIDGDYTRVDETTHDPNVKK